MIALPKNAREEFRIERQDYRGHDMINVRVWFDDGSGMMRPGKQGIAFKACLLPDVVSALEAVSEQLEAA